MAKAPTRSVNIRLSEQEITTLLELQEALQAEVGPSLNVTQRTVISRALDLYKQELIKANQRRAAKKKD